MVDRGGVVDDAIDRLEDRYGEIPVHRESTPVPREMYVECMDAADNGELGGVRVLVANGNDHLLVQRTDDEAWDVPGGSLSGNDTHETAGMQHVADQVGLECRITNAFAAVEREFTLVDGGEGVSGLWVFFEAEAFDTAVTPAPDIRTADWFTHPPDELSPHLVDGFAVAPGSD